MAYRMRGKLFASSISNGIFVQNIYKELKNQILQTNKQKPIQLVRWVNEMDGKFSTVQLQLAGKHDKVDDESVQHS